MLQVTGFQDSVGEKNALLCHDWLNPQESTSAFGSADWDEEGKLEKAQVGKRKRRLCCVIIFR